MGSKPKGRCPLRDSPCPEHGFIHGKEAEELRKGIENIIRKGEWRQNTHDVLCSLQKLLDTVDARDSLAWLESHEDHRA